jgi:hypothetical protein
MKLFCYALLPVLAYAESLHSYTCTCDDGAPFEYLAAILSDEHGRVGVLQPVEALTNMQRETRNDIDVSQPMLGCVRAEARGSGTLGTVVDCPIVPIRQFHPNIHVLFVPDDHDEHIEVWPRAEFTKYFRFVR